MPSQREPKLSESQARRASALKSALGPLTDLLDDPRVVEVMLNADGVVWVERVGDPSALPDIFYTRVGALLGGRLPAHKVLLHLLRATRESSIAEPAHRTAHPGPEGADR